MTATDAPAPSEIAVHDPTLEDVEREWNEPKLELIDQLEGVGQT